MSITKYKIHSDKKSKLYAPKGPDVNVCIDTATLSTKHWIFDGSHVRLTAQMASFRRGKHARQIFLLALLPALSSCRYNRLEAPSPLEYVHQVLWSFDRQKEDPVVAEIPGGYKVTASEFVDSVKSLPPEARRWADTPEGRRNRLSLLIQQKELMLAAEREGIAYSPEYLSAENAFRREELSRLYLDRLAGQITVTPQEVEAYYAAHRDLYTVRRLGICELVFPSARAADLAALRLNRKEKPELVARLLKGKLTRKEFLMSDANSILRSLLSGLKVGEVSLSLASANGTAIYIYEQELPPDQIPLADVRDAIQKSLAQEAVGKRIGRALESSKAVVYEKALSETASVNGPAL